MCAIRRALGSARLFRELFETRHRLLLGEQVSDAEYVSDEQGERQLALCGDFIQGCWDGYTGHAVLCDTDFIALTPEGGANKHPMPFVTSVSDRAWGGFYSFRRHRLVDMPCAYARSVLRPLQNFAPLLAPLADELEARGSALLRGDLDVVQISFSCIEAWISAAWTVHEKRTLMLG